MLCARQLANPEVAELALRGSENPNLMPKDSITVRMHSVGGWGAITTDGSFPPSTYPLESVGHNVPSLPNRLEPYREFTSVFHDEQTNSQVFPRWYGNPVLNYTLAGVKDQFMINYGSGGIDARRVRITAGDPFVAGGGQGVFVVKGGVVDPDENISPW